MEMQMLEEDLKQQEEQMTKDIQKIFESIQPMIAQYVAYKTSQDIVNKNIAECLIQLDARVKIIEDKLGLIGKVEE